MIKYLIRLWRDICADLDDYNDRSGCLINLNPEPGRAIPGGWM